MRFGFYGHSDDIFMVMKDGRDLEEIYPPEQYILTDPDGGRMVFTAVYATREGVWTIGVEPFDEDIGLPVWPVKVGLAQSGYSTLFEVEVPEDTELSILNRHSD